MLKNKSKTKRFAFALSYYVTTLILYLFAIPILVFLGFKSKFKTSLPARFALIRNEPFEASGIWIHAASLGEARAIKPLVDGAKHHVNLTVTTQTGYAEATKYKHATLRYLPFEIFLPFWIHPQKALFVMEAELWYLVFLVAKYKGAKTHLINARINDRSYKSYFKNRWLYKQLFKHIDVVLAQSETDKERLASLGAQNITVCGNLKLATKIETTHPYTKPNTLVITAASTHEGEELLALEAFLKLENPNKKLLIAPRHPERFEVVGRLIESYRGELNYHNFSVQNDFESDIVLVDTIGELINIYAISDVVLLGGAWANIGGHNPLEPAHFGCKLISGEHIFNQKALFELIDNYTLCKSEDLINVLSAHDTILPAKINKEFDLEGYQNALQPYIQLAI